MKREDSESDNPKVALLLGCSVLDAGASFDVLQEFETGEDDAAADVFFLPLAWGAAVRGLEVQVGDSRVIRATVLEKGAAEAAFLASIEAGRSSSSAFLSSRSQEVARGFRLRWLEAAAFGATRPCWAFVLIQHLISLTAALIPPLRQSIPFHPSVRSQVVLKNAGVDVTNNILILPRRECASDICDPFLLRFSSRH